MASKIDRGQSYLRAAVVGSSDFMIDSPGRFFLLSPAFGERGKGACWIDSASGSISR